MNVQKLSVFKCDHQYRPRVGGSQCVKCGDIVPTQKKVMETQYFVKVDYDFYWENVDKRWNWVQERTGIKLPKRTGNFESDRKLYLKLEKSLKQHNHEQDPFYPFYLKTKYWKALRDAVYKRGGGICEREGCTNPIEQTHHLNYDRIYEENLTDLKGWCGNCHTTHHNIKSKPKPLTPGQRRANRNKKKKQQKQKNVEDMTADQFIKYAEKKKGQKQQQKQRNKSEQNNQNIRCMCPNCGYKMKMKIS